jgi:spectinomycin phosphotransferase
VRNAVQTPPPPDQVSETDLEAALEQGWGLRVTDLRYFPKGFGSHHWTAEANGRSAYLLTVDDLDTKPWLGRDRATVLSGLRAGYSTALRLQQRCGLEFVVAPVVGVDGAPVRRLTPRHSLAVFPFVDGRSGEWGDRLDPVGHDQLERLLARLHLATGALSWPVPERRPELSGRPDLEDALADLPDAWTGGPFSEPARRLLAEHAGGLRRWLSAFDLLAARVGDSGRGLVLTHGEPHPGNLLRVNGGFRLVDWDTVALAPAERDLWMLADEAEGLATYRAQTATEIDGSALALYRMAWPLEDIAAFLRLFRDGHQRDLDTEKSWAALARTLAEMGSPPV